MKTPKTSSRKSSLLVGTLLLTCAFSAEAATKTYRYYQFVPSKLRGAGNSIQLSEFRFIAAGSPLSLTSVTVTNPGGNNPTGEPPINVKDGSVDTKYLDFNKYSPLVFDFQAETSIDSYNFATANDAAERDPVSWTFQGSHDGTTWTILDSRTDVSYPTTRKIYVATPFTIPENLNPLITNYMATPAVALNGASVILNWQVDLATSVSINNGVGTVTAVGPINVTPPANATTTYTLTATNSTTGLTSTKDVNVRSVPAGTEATYRYVRFTPTKLRDDASANSIQMADFFFVNDDLLLNLAATDTTPAAVATNPGGNNPVGQEPDKALDNVNSTKWLDFNKGPLVIDFGVNRTFDAYGFVTGGDAPERDPVRWRLEGSLDGTAWAPIDDMTKFDFPTTATRGAATQDIPLPGSSLPAPILSFSADAPTSVSGQPVILTWSTQLADTVTINNGVGTVTGNGTVTVSPTATTTYTLTATKAGAAANTAQVTVTVINPTNTTINYANFDNAGPEIITLKSASVVNDPTRTLPGNFKRLRITPDEGSKTGSAWFAKRVDFSQGFDTTFDMSFITLSGGSGADGMAFVIQNNGNSVAPTSPEDKGFLQKSFAVSFDSYVNAPELTAASVQVITNRTVQSLVEIPTVFPNLGITDFSQSTAGAAPHHVRIAYSSGKLNVYLNDTQVITDLAVDLAASGALDASGKAWVGFAARTGGLYEAHDITAWTLTTGSVATTPLAIKSYSISASAGSAALTWSSNAGKTYRVTTSADLVNWTALQSGIASGGATTSATVSFTAGAKGFFRVEQE